MPAIFVMSILFFFFNDTATTEIYTLSLHDALPISPSSSSTRATEWVRKAWPYMPGTEQKVHEKRSEEHTSELQSRPHLVCRLLLEKKKTENETKRAITSSHSCRRLASA